MIQRTVFEWGSIEYGEGLEQIPLRIADRIAKAAANVPLSGRSGEGVLEQRRTGLRAKGVVGVVAADGGVLEILPKMDASGEHATANIAQIRRRLVHMLAVALDLNVDVGRVTDLDWRRDTLLEILIRLFCEQLSQAVRRGMPRRYLAHTEDLPVLRGRLDVSRQFGVLAADQSRLACHYDALTSDIALNRIMKAAVARLFRGARSAENQRRLRELMFTYGDVTDIPVSNLRWGEVVLDRTNNHWVGLLDLARLLLGDRFQTTSLGFDAGFSLLFPMNTLFEEYVARMLKRALANTDFRVISQGGRLFCLETDDGRGLYQTRPDVLIKRRGAVVQVIDTKWKCISPKATDAKLGVSQSDVYQMMAYGQLYECDRLTLLYPHHLAVGADEGLHAAHQVKGVGRRLEIATIDVGRSDLLPKRLRAIVEQ